MCASDVFNDESRHILRAREIESQEQELLLRVACELISVGSSTFQYGQKIFRLNKSGLSYNLGYKIESENLDGSENFQHSWSALTGDEDWQIFCIKNGVSRLLASQDN
jgi:hypothetical protein